MINSIKLVFQCFYLLFRPLFKGVLKLGQTYKNIFVGFLVHRKSLEFAFEINWPLPNTGVFSIRHRVSTWRLPIKNTHEMIQLIRDLIIYWNQIFSKNKIQMVEWVVVLQIVTSEYQIITKKKPFFQSNFHSSRNQHIQIL